MNNKKGFIISLVLLFWLTVGVGHALAQEAPAAPAFSERISSVFPDRAFETCTQGHHEADPGTPHHWFVRTHASGELTIDVSAIAVNTVEESGSVIAKLYDGQTLLGQATVEFPTGQDAQNGDENIGAIGPVQVPASAVLRLEVTRGAPISTAGEGHHYKLGFSDVGGERVDLGLSSPAFQYLEGKPQVFHMNAVQGENFRLAFLGDSDPHAPQATFAGRS